MLFFFANDDLTIGALFHCQSHGILMSEQIALAGLNGFEMRRLTGDMILKTLEGKQISKSKVQIMELEIIVGETT